MKAFLRISFLSIILFSCINYAEAQTNADTDTLHIGDRTFSKVEVEVSFPGGPAAWVKYISKYINDNIQSLNKRDYGTCIVRFIVNKNGHTSDVEATNMKKSRLAKLVVETIENGPKWIPAQQNGRPVNAYRLQPVTVSDPRK
jgi:protein TonB